MPKPFRETPARIGAMWTRIAHEKMVRHPSVESLRALLSDESVPVEKRETFDDGLLLLTIFAGYVSARRQFPIHIAEQFLGGSLSPILRACSNSDAEAIQERIGVYRRGCPGDGTRTKDLSELLYCFLWELYDDHDARDAMSNATLSIWIANLMKTVEVFLEQVEFTES